jgi:hypothetical protein
MTHLLPWHADGRRSDTASCCNHTTQELESNASFTTDRAAAQVQSGEDLTEPADPSRTTTAPGGSTVTIAPTGLTTIAPAVDTVTIAPAQPTTTSA